MLAALAMAANGAEAARLHGLLAEREAQIARRDQTIAELRVQLESLQQQIVALRRAHFGAKSERLGGQAELFCETVCVPLAPPVTERVSYERERRGRPALPKDLPRRRIEYDLSEAEKSEFERVERIGEELSETLDYTPAKLLVIEHARAKYVCERAGESTIRIAAAQPSPLAKSNASAGLLAQVLVAKYADHIPLARQERIFARHGVPIARTTLCEWTLGAAELFEVLIAPLTEQVLGAPRLHCDDTTVPLAEPGRGKTKIARLWGYLGAGSRPDETGQWVDHPPGVVFEFTASRESVHPLRFLADYRGYLQADAYAGFDCLYRTGRVIEVGCWAHYLERRFIQTCWVSVRVLAIRRSAAATPHNSQPLRRRWSAPRGPPLQIPLRHSLECRGVHRRARVAHCPLGRMSPCTRNGGCSFARHGSYSRVTPHGVRIARWYCPEGHRTFSLLPDFLAAKLPGLLTSIEAAAEAVKSAGSMESAADALRGFDVTLPSAVRWLRRRVRAVQAAVDAVSSALPTPMPARASSQASRIDPGSGVLLELRRTLPAAIIAHAAGALGLPAPRSWTPSCHSQYQHHLGPDDDHGIRYGACTTVRHRLCNASPSATIPKLVVPTIRDMLRVWRADRCVQDSSAGVYLQWISASAPIARGVDLDERAELTRDGAHRFIAMYARRRHLDSRRLGGARTALYALSRVYQVMGLSPPAWQATRRAQPPASALLRAYAEHLARHRGNPEVTVHKKLDHVGKLLEASGRSRQDLAHDDAAGHRRVPDRLRASLCALDRRRHRRQRPLLHPLPARHRAHHRSTWPRP